MGFQWFYGAKFSSNEPINKSTAPQICSISSAWLQSSKLDPAGGLSHRDYKKIKKRAVHINRLMRMNPSS